MQLIKPEKPINEDKATARPSREFVYGYGTDAVDATPTAFSMMFSVSTYVDYDGLIQLSKIKIRERLKIQPNFFVRTLESAKQAGFIEERNGKLYSLVHTFKKTSDFDFVQNYSRLVEGKFPNIGKWATKLFAYILGATASGFVVVNIENLYRNKLHTAPNGLNYFPDARRVVNSLVTLLQHDLIHMEIPAGGNNNRVVLNKKNIKNHRKLLEDYVEISNEVQSNTSFTCRKKRTSAMKANKHVLFIRLSNSVATSKEKVCASREELKTILTEHNYSIDLLRENTITSIIGIKNSLYKAAGQAGLNIYRKSLSVFLSEKFPLIDFYEQREFQVYNHFMNYYVLSSVQLVLLQVAKDIKETSVQNAALTDQFTISYGKMNIQEVKGLLKFFNKNSSRNHIVVMEKLLVDIELDLHSLRKTNMPWEYIFYQAAGIRKLFLIHDDILLPPHELREITYEAAKENLLHDEERYIQYVKQFIDSKNLYYDTAVANGLTSAYDRKVSEDRTRTIQFYNWLEDRD